MLTFQWLYLYDKFTLMFALKGILLSFFGWLLVSGSTDLATVPDASYSPVESIEASDHTERVPLFFDAVLEVNHASTYETPVGENFPHTSKVFQSAPAPLFYELSYYAIGQQIVVNLSVKTIIFPFHCFT